MDLRRPLEACALRQVLRRQGRFALEQPAVKLLVVLLRGAADVVPGKPPDAGILRQQRLQDRGQQPAAAARLLGRALAEGQALPGKEPLRPVVGPIQFLPGEGRVRGDVDAEGGTLRQVLKLQGSQPEQPPAGLPPGPEAPVKDPAAGYLMGFPQKPGEASHRGKIQLFRQAVLPVRPPGMAGPGQGRRQLGHAAVLPPEGDAGGHGPPGVLRRFRRGQRLQGELRQALRRPLQGLHHRLRQGQRLCQSHDGGLVRRHSSVPAMLTPAMRTAYGPSYRAVR